MTGSLTRRLAFHRPLPREDMRSQGLTLMLAALVVGRRGRPPCRMVSLLYLSDAENDQRRGDRKIENILTLPTGSAQNQNWSISQRSGVSESLRGQDRESLQHWLRKEVWDKGGIKQSRVIQFHNHIVICHFWQGEGELLHCTWPKVRYRLQVVQALDLACTLYLCKLCKTFDVKPHWTWNRIKLKNQNLKTCPQMWRGAGRRLSHNWGSPVQVS